MKKQKHSPDIEAARVVLREILFPANKHRRWRCCDLKWTRETFCHQCGRKCPQDSPHDHGFEVVAMLEFRIRAVEGRMRWLFRLANYGESEIGNPECDAFALAKELRGYPHDKDTHEEHLHECTVSIKRLRDEIGTIAKTRLKYCAWRNSVCALLSALGVAAVPEPWMFRIEE